MKSIVLSFAIFIASSTTLFAQSSKIPLRTFVNPFIGTGGHGHTFPGPTMPFGACQSGPDTRLTGWDGCSGYHYSDSIIYGFSHTHLSGTGCSDYGDILLMPVSKEMQLDNYQYASHFSHKNEDAQVGYYQVDLPDNEVSVELTSTLHGAIHHYTYQRSDKMFVVLDLKHRDQVLDSKMEQVDDYTLQGYRYSKAWGTNQKVFYRITFSKPIESIQYQPAKASSLTGAVHLEKSLQCILKFKEESSSPIASELKVKVAISGVDEAGAAKNMQQEMPDWNFQKYRSLAEEAWEKELRKINIKDSISPRSISTKDSSFNQRTIFYTALYHCMIHPSLYSDVDGRYRGRDDKIQNTEGKFDYYTVFSLWDTYRGLHPLLTIIDPKRTNDIINTFIKQYEQGGRLPIWELSSNETNCMIGYHVVSVIWDAYKKGIRNYDAEMAFKAMCSIATNENDYKLVNGVLTLNESAKKGSADADALESYNRYGYVRSDDSHESVSKTLEYAYDDWCISEMALTLGKKKEHEYYLNRSHNWMNVYDPTTGFMRARKNGVLYEPFSPYTVDNNYTEANSWQYSFYVPHDMQSLVAVHGGKEKFEQHMEELFTANEKTQGREQADITGLIGQYAHGNEPSHQLAYLFHFGGKPEMTDHQINFIRRNFYKNDADGLIGNEDCGQMSAWLVMTSMGIYPVCPGNGEYQVSEPWFNAMDVNNTILIRKNNKGKQDGKTSFGITHQHSISHRDFIEPSVKNFAVAIDNNDQVDKVNPITTLAVPFINGGSRIFKTKRKVEIKCITPNATIYYSLNKAPYQKYTSPFEIKENSSIKFYSSSTSNKTTKQSPVQYAEFTQLPTDIHVTLNATYNPSYSAGGPDAMIDGLHGKVNWRAGDWQGYQGQDVETILKFDNAKNIRTLSASFLEDQNAWIFYPKSVTFYTSVDGTNWKLIETIPTNKSDHEEKTTISTFTSTFPPTTSSYVKMVAKNFGPMPEWHEGRGNPTFIFIDEIEAK